MINLNVKAPTEEEAQRLKEIIDKTFGDKRTMLRFRGETLGFAQAKSLAEGKDRKAVLNFEGNFKYISKESIPFMEGRSDYSEEHFKRIIKDKLTRDFTLHRQISFMRRVENGMKVKFEGWRVVKYVEFG